jgi:hypothetical protein
MSQRFNRFLDLLSNFLAHRKGLLPLVGIAFILLNLVLTFTVKSWLTSSNLFLHLGLIIAILGFLLAWAL